MTKLFWGGIKCILVKSSLAPKLAAREETMKKWRLKKNVKIKQQLDGGNNEIKPQIQERKCIKINRNKEIKIKYKYKHLKKKTLGQG